MQLLHLPSKNRGNLFKCISEASGPYDILTIIKHVGLQGVAMTNTEMRIKSKRQLEIPKRTTTLDSIPWCLPLLVCRIVDADAPSCQCRIIIVLIGEVSGAAHLSQLPKQASSRVYREKRWD